MRCRFKHKIFQNEENGYTIAIFTTQDTSVPLSARDKYLASPEYHRLLSDWIRSSAYRRD